MLPLLETRCYSNGLTRRAAPATLAACARLVLVGAADVRLAVVPALRRAPSFVLLRRHLFAHLVVVVGDLARDGITVIEVDGSERSYKSNDVIAHYLRWREP